MDNKYLILFVNILFMLPVFRNGCKDPIVVLLVGGKFKYKPEIDI
jgi:hypothetical protein